MKSLVGVFSLLIAAAGAAQEPPRRDFEPVRVALDLKAAKVSSILEAIKRQTGYEIPVGRNMKDPVLETFQVEGSFWEVMDRLCQASGNVFRWSDRKG